MEGKSASTPLVFTVRRQEAELVAPAKPTTRELKSLSDIDNQQGFRYLVADIFFYRRKPNGKDPVAVIKEALAKLLVFYYPLAGRLRERPDRKLVVDCTGEGVIFIGADADVRLEDFGDNIQPPFPCVKELLFNVPGSAGVIDCPLVLIQVTRLLCGGFIFALRLNHVMADGAGVVQFLRALTEIARGASKPVVMPVWGRELLNVRDAASPQAYEEVDETKGTIIPSEVVHLVHRSIFIGPHELSTLRRLLPPHLRGRSRFEVLAAFLWRCRTIALKPDPEKEVKLLYAVNARSMFTTALPAGYYGNAIFTWVVVSTAGRISSNPLGYTLDLLRKAKADGAKGNMRSVANPMLLRSGLSLTAVSDISRSGPDELDFGWGLPVYAGTVGGVRTAPFSLFMSATNEKGEKGVLITVNLPELAMARFVEEVDAMLKDGAGDVSKPTASKRVSSL